MDALTALAHWVYVIALALWAGSLITLLVVAPGGRRVRREDMALLEPLRHRTQVVAWWSVIALIASLAVELCLRTLALSGSDGLAAFVPSLKELLFGSRYGEASLARWVLLVGSLWAVDEFGRDPTVSRARVPRPGRHALGIVSGGMRRAGVPLRGAAWERIAAALACAIVLCTAIAGPFGATVVGALVEALHLGATVAWLGGAILLALVVPPFINLVERSRRPMALLALLDRFSPVALLSVVVLSLTGAWEAGHGPYPPHSHVAAAVGVALMLKTLLLVAIVVVSAWGLFILRPRLRGLAVRLRRDTAVAPAVGSAQSRVLRPLLLNAGLAVLALLCGGIADTAPHTVSAAAPRHSGLSVTGRAGPIAVTLGVTPDAVGANTFNLRLRDAQGRDVTGATVVVEIQTPRSGEGGPGPIIAAELGRGRYQARGLFSSDGRWNVHVSVRTGSTMTAALFTLTVARAHAPVATVTPPLAQATRVPGGATLQPIWQPLGPSVIAHALVADPAEKARLFEGTVSGVYRSLDGGKHWAVASTGLSGSAREVWSLTFLPDHSLIAATGGGIYRSTDGAGHWRITGLGTRSIYTLATHQAGHVVLLAGGDGGIFRSDDLAAHWHTVYTTGQSVVSSLAWPAVRPSLIVAGINPGPNPIAVSYDGGATWQVQRLRLPPIVGMMSVAVAPGATVVYAGSMGLGAYVSSGQGRAWQSRNVGLPGLKTGDAHIASFAFALASPTVLYAATDYGVYKSSDAGQHWAPFGAGLNGDAAVVTALTLVTGPHPALYATTAGGLYRCPLPVMK